MITFSFIKSRFEIRHPRFWGRIEHLDEHDVEAYAREIAQSIGKKPIESTEERMFMADMIFCFIPEYFREIQPKLASMARMLS